MGIHRCLTRWSRYGLLLALAGPGSVASHASGAPVAWLARAPRPMPAPRAAARTPRSASRGPDSVLAITNVTVLDVQTGTLYAGQTVVVVGHRIHAVGPAHRLSAPPGARIVDGTGGYLLPGLWDMHMHQYQYAAVRDPLLIANGITGAREPYLVARFRRSPLVGLLDSALGWRRQIAAGQRVGPRLVFGIPVEPETPEQARHLVDSLQAAGADFIKNYLNYTQDAGVRKPILLASYFALAAEARRVGIPFEGHVIQGVSAVQASDSGQHILDHHSGNGPCYGVPATVDPDWNEKVGDSASLARCRAFARHLRRNGTWLVPTLGVMAPAGPRRYIPQPMRWGVGPLESTGGLMGRDMIPGDALRLAAQAGVPLLAGSDQFAVGFSLHHELAVMVREGLSPLGALQAATLNPAKALHATDSLGTVAPGKLADLVLLDANPLVDIHNTREIRAVVANGRYFDRAALDSLLVQAEAAADAAE